MAQVFLDCSMYIVYDTYETPAKKNMTRMSEWYQLNAYTTVTIHQEASTREYIKITSP